MDKVISDEEKKVLFDYLQMPYELIYEQTGKPIERYAQNVILIINSFFEYGFLSTKSAAHPHYWSLIRDHFSVQQSVSYIKEQGNDKGEANLRDRGISWVTIALSEKNLLVYCIQEAYTIPEISKGYDAWINIIWLNKT